MLRVSSKMVLLSPNMLIDALIVMMGSVTPGYKKKKLNTVRISPMRGSQVACCQGFNSTLSI
jgi:hypothetical protein